MGHDPETCTVPQCIDCRKATGAVDRSGSGSGDADRDDTRERAAGGRLVKVDDPRKKDPADAEPLPTGGLSDRQVAELNDVFERAADASSPDAAELSRIERVIERRRGRSKVDLTERDIERAQMSTREQLLEALEGLAGIQKDTGAALRKADDDGDGDDGRQSAREQDLIHAVADLLDVSEGTVREHFNAVRDDGEDTDAAAELAEQLADHLGIPERDAAALLDELRDADDGGDGGDADEDAADDGATGRSKATVRKSLGAARVGTDATGRAALVTDDGDTVALDGLAGTGR